MNEKQLAEIEAVFSGDFEIDDVFIHVPTLIAEVRAQTSEIRQLKGELLALQTAVVEAIKSISEVTNE